MTRLCARLCDWTAVVEATKWDLDINTAGVKRGTLSVGGRQLHHNIDIFSLDLNNDTVGCHLKCSDLGFFYGAV